MLKVPQGKVIVGFAPCVTCNSISTVHFPKSGKRVNTPYLSCAQCGTKQSKLVPEHIKGTWVKSLDEYAEKYSVSVDDEKAQIEANKHAINNSMSVRFTGIGEEVEQSVTEKKTVTKSDEKKAVTIEHETGEVVEDEEKESGKNKGNDDKTEGNTSDGISGFLVFGVVLVLCGAIAVAAHAVSKSKGVKDEQD